MLRVIFSAPSYEKWTIKALKSELKRLSLPTEGSRSALVKRLQSAVVNTAGEANEANATNEMPPATKQDMPEHVSGEQNQVVEEASESPSGDKRTKNEATPSPVDSSSPAPNQEVQAQAPESSELAPTPPVSPFGSLSPSPVGSPTKSCLRSPAKKRDPIRIQWKEVEVRQYERCHGGSNGVPSKGIRCSCQC